MFAIPALLWNAKYQLLTKSGDKCYIPVILTSPLTPPQKFLPPQHNQTDNITCISPALPSSQNMPIFNQMLTQKSKRTQCKNTYSSLGTNASILMT